ncbi:hypothetical protein ACQW02_03030 [Humitalea sp. 24SJ18S-53]|uniref:hypothetical protein n=1 Tax=Humitalea sp. 24SJ18S-53 TaxID=3422307 RepID=UPI003D6725F3
MHTVIVLGGGFALLLACLLLGHAWGGMPGAVMGGRVFIPLWLVLAGVNLWVGTTHGYTVAQELPIFLGIFAVPAVIAGLVSWKLA